MNDLQLELTRLIGEKELTFWCLILIPKSNIYARKNKEWYWYIHFMTSETTMNACLNNWNYIPSFYFKERNVEIIWHPATLSDLHRFINSKQLIFDWTQNSEAIILKDENGLCEKRIPYDSSKDLLDQSTTTLEALISLIKSIC